ncbi:MAG: SpoIIE family protein phosphatase [Paracoccaceae bacterium]|nr:SpoIIE family protein phosphatase [Paracoccaceae bacterium]
MAAPERHVLVVDDSKAQRKILSMSLLRWGYRVREAASGEEALALCQSMAFDIVISDWVMPGMSGLDLCKAFRVLPREGYGYFILLTSKSEKEEVANGLDCGADDFLTKPVSADELRARLRAGERIIGMQSELVEKNRLIGSTLGELQKIYDSLDRDLIEARKLQQTLVRERYREFDGGSVSILLRPSGHVGGDLAGFFEIAPRRIAVFSVDVSGHGVASAMMTARLAGLLSGSSPEQNIAMTISENGYRDAWPPEMVAARLNRLMLEEMQVDQYFTIAYAEIDLDSGRVLLVQAGHPHPMVLRANGETELLGQGGLPIGLIPGARYERVEAQLCAGDRLFLVSDGVTECPDSSGLELGAEGLGYILQANAGLESRALLEALVWNLNDFNGGADFPDDVSGALFHFDG